MKVTPLVVLKGKKYSPVPNGMGENPTQYQLSEDKEKLVTMKFPSVRVIQAFQEKALERSEAEDPKMDTEDDYPDYHLAVLIVEGDLPEPGDCHPGTLTRLIQDFMHASQPISDEPVNT